MRPFDWIEITLQTDSAFFARFSKSLLFCNAFDFFFFLWWASFYDISLVIWEKISGWLSLVFGWHHTNMWPLKVSNLLFYCFFACLFFAIRVCAVKPLALSLVVELNFSRFGKQPKVWKHFWYKCEIPGWVSVVHSLLIILEYLCLHAFAFPDCQKERGMSN